MTAWQKRYREDRHSRAFPLGYSVRASAFRLDDPKAASKIDFATPLPAQADWRQPDPAQVGAARRAWPTSAEGGGDVAKN